MFQRLELERRFRRIVDELRKVNCATGACQRTNVSLEDCEEVLGAMEWEIAIELIAELCNELVDEGVAVDKAIRQDLVICATILSLPDPLVSTLDTTVPTYEELFEEFESQAVDKNPLAFARLLKDHGVDRLNGVRMLRQIYRLELKSAAESYDGVVF